MDVKSILIVDDEIDICQSIADCFSILGHKSVIATDGLQALQKFSKQKFDLIVTDINMPKANGLKLIQAVINNSNRNKKSIPPFIVISGDLSLFKNYLEKIDNVEILPKPFQLEQLQELAISIFSGNKKAYQFKRPDQLLILTEKILSKMFNTLLGIDILQETNTQECTGDLTFENDIQLHINYFDETFCGKMIINFKQDIIVKIINSLNNNENFTDKNITDEFFKILVNVLQKSVNRKFIKFKLIDYLYTSGETKILKSSNAFLKSTSYYDLYNINLNKKDNA